LAQNDEPSGTEPPQRGQAVAGPAGAAGAAAGLKPFMYLRTKKRVTAKPIANVRKVSIYQFLEIPQRYDEADVHDYQHPE
jgi:hypothetical protein